MSSGARVGAPVDMTQTGWRRYAPNLLLVVLALALVGLSFETGRKAGMADGRIEPSLRYRIYAVPIILSQIYYGRPYDYTAYKKVANPFMAATPPIDDLIAASKSIPSVDSEGLFFILADDKGSVDFARIAFKLYGFKASSLYPLYFTIVLASCLLYAICYFTDAPRLALLVLLCLAFYATMPGFLAFPPGINVLDVHSFGMLSLIAFVHVLVAATDPHSTRPRQLLTTLGQALIMVFVYHSRASTITQALTVVAASPLIVFLDRRERVRGSQYLRRLVPAAIVLVVTAMLPVYQRLMYNPDYFGRRATLGHIVYHNLLIGLQWNPVLKDLYSLGSGDLGAARAVDLYLETRTNKHPGRKGWAAADLNSVTTQMPFDWVEYEESARELYFTIWKEQPREVLKTMYHYHPLDIYSVVRAQLGWNPMPNFDANYAYDPFRPASVVVLLAAIVLGTIGGRSIRPLHAFIAAVALASALLVPVIVYAGGFVILAEAFTSFSLLLYTLFGLPLSWLLTSRRNQLPQS